MLMLNFLLILIVIYSCPSESFCANTGLYGGNGFSRTVLFWASLIELFQILLLVILFWCASSLFDLHLHHDILTVLASKMVATLLMSLIRIALIIFILRILFCSYSRFGKFLGNV